MSMDDDVVLSAEGLYKSFGEQAAVAGLSFQVRRGECFGLLGPNGAGKSTTLKLLLGLTTPDNGSIQLLGRSIPAQARQARAKVGVVPQADALDPDFTVAENLLVFGRYFGLSTAQASAKIDALLEFGGLSNRHSARIGELSGGMKRRLTLARSLINDPEILFLDEPTTGLDPQARHLIWERLKQWLGRGGTILLTTHFMDEAERLCNRLAVLDHGRLIACDTPRGLIDSQIEPQVLELTGEQLTPWCDGARTRYPRARIEQVGETAFVYCDDAIALTVELASYPQIRVLHRRANLEDVFLKLTGRDLRD
jgi:lipooligosaccharide transport system ATP-binding protein